jgi:hypothetical protein
MHVGNSDAVVTRDRRIRSRRIQFQEKKLNAPLAILSGDLKLRSAFLEKNGGGLKCIVWSSKLKLPTVSKSLLIGECQVTKLHIITAWFKIFLCVYRYFEIEYKYYIELGSVA